MWILGIEPRTLEKANDFDSWDSYLFSPTRPLLSLLNSSFSIISSLLSKGLLNTFSCIPPQAIIKFPHDDLPLPLSTICIFQSCLQTHTCPSLTFQVVQPIARIFPKCNPPHTFSQRVSKALMNNYPSRVPPLGFLDVMSCNYWMCPSIHL